MWSYVTVKRVSSHHPPALRSGCRTSPSPWSSPLTNASDRLMPSSSPCHYSVSCLYGVLTLSCYIHTISPSGICCSWLFSLSVMALRSVQSVAWINTWLFLAPQHNNLAPFSLYPSPFKHLPTEDIRVVSRFGWIKSPNKMKLKIQLPWPCTGISVSVCFPFFRINSQECNWLWYASCVFIYFFKKLSNCFPERLFHFTLLPAMHEKLSLYILTSIWYYHYF